MPPRRSKSTAPQHGELLDLHAYYAQREEKSLKLSVKNTFRQTLNHIRQPFIKSVAKAETSEQFEEILNKPSIENILNQNTIIISILYVKTIQLFTINYSQIVLKGIPSEAATQLKSKIDCICKTTGFNQKNTREILIKVAQKIQSINPKKWSILIKYFNVSFDNKAGSVILSKLFNIRNLGTNQKLVEFMKDNIDQIDDLNL